MSDFESFIHNSDEIKEGRFESIKKQVLFSNEVLNEEDDDDELDNDADNSSAITAFTSVKRGEENSQNEEDFENENIYDVNEELWRYRSGNAFNETQREYEILRTYLEMGRSRSSIQLKRIFNLSDKYLVKLREKNNWVERIDAYDRNTYLNALSEETTAREEEHRRKLEYYRAQQETLAQQSASGAAKMLHLINRKLNKLVEDTDNLSIDEMVSVGNLSTKLVQLQKDIGAQALGVDALLEAIEDDGAQ